MNQKHESKMLETMETNKRRSPLKPFDIENVRRSPRKKVVKQTERGRRKLDFHKDEKRAATKKDVLHGYKVFLDIQLKPTAEEIKKRILSLGGVVEDFLDRQVNLIVTSKKIVEKTDKDGTIILTAQSPMSATLPSPLQPFSNKQSVGRSCSPFSADSSQHSIDGSKKEKPTHETRGQKLIQKVLSTKKGAGKVDICQRAKNLGAKIITAKEFSAMYMKKSSSLSIRSLKEKPPQNLKKTVSRTVTDIKVAKPAEPYFKIEDQSRAFRPLTYERKNNWPILYYDTNQYQSPFEFPNEKKHDKSKAIIHADDIDDEETISLIGKSDKISEHEDEEGDIMEECKEETTNVKPSSMKNKKKKKKDVEEKPGYCDCCAVRYKDRKKHLNNNQHRTFASNNSNFKQLDELISKCSPFQQIIDDLKACVKLKDVDRNFDSVMNEHNQTCVEQAKSVLKFKRCTLGFENDSVITCDINTCRIKHDEDTTSDDKSKNEHNIIVSKNPTNILISIKDHQSLCKGNNIINDNKLPIPNIPKSPAKFLVSNLTQNVYINNSPKKQLYDKIHELHVIENRYDVKVGDEICAFIAPMVSTPIKDQGSPDSDVMAKYVAHEILNTKIEQPLGSTNTAKNRKSTNELLHRENTISVITSSTTRRTRRSSDCRSQTTENRSPINQEILRPTLSKASRNPSPIKLSIANRNPSPIKLSIANRNPSPIKLSKANRNPSPIKLSIANRNPSPIKLSKANRNPSPIKLSKANPSPIKVVTSSQQLEDSPVIRKAKRRNNHRAISQTYYSQESEQDDYVRIISEEVQSSTQVKTTDINVHVSHAHVSLANTSSDCLCSPNPQVRSLFEKSAGREIIFKSDPEVTFNVCGDSLLKKLFSPQKSLNRHSGVNHSIPGGVHQELTSDEILLRKSFMEQNFSDDDGKTVIKRCFLMWKDEVEVYCDLTSCPNKHETLRSSPNKETTTNAVDFGFSDEEEFDVSCNINTISNGLNVDEFCGVDNISVAILKQGSTPKGGKSKRQESRLGKVDDVDVVTAVTQNTCTTPNSKRNNPHGANDNKQLLRSPLSCKKALRSVNTPPRRREAFNDAINQINIKSPSPSHKLRSPLKKHSHNVKKRVATTPSDERCRKKSRTNSYKETGSSSSSTANEHKKSNQIFTNEYEKMELIDDVFDERNDGNENEIIAHAPVTLNISDDNSISFVNEDGVTIKNFAGQSLLNAEICSTPLEERNLPTSQELIMVGEFIYDRIKNRPRNSVKSTSVSQMSSRASSPAPRQRSDSEKTHNKISLQPPENQYKQNIVQKEQSLEIIRKSPRKHCYEANSKERSSKKKSSLRCSPRKHNNEFITRVTSLSRESKLKSKSKKCSPFTSGNPQKTKTTNNQDTSLEIFEFNDINLSTNDVSISKRNTSADPFAFSVQPSLTTKKHKSQRKRAKTPCKSKPSKKYYSGDDDDDFVPHKSSKIRSR